MCWSFGPLWGCKINTGEDEKVKYVSVRESGRDNKQPRQGAVSAAARMAALTGDVRIERRHDCIKMGGQAVNLLGGPSLHKS